MTAIRYSRVDAALLGAIPKPSHTDRCWWHRRSGKVYMLPFASERLALPIRLPELLVPLIMHGASLQQAQSFGAGMH